MVLLEPWWMWLLVSFKTSSRNHYNVVINNIKHCNCPGWAGTFKSHSRCYQQLFAKPRKNVQSDVSPGMILNMVASLIRRFAQHLIKMCLAGTFSVWNTLEQAITCKSHSKWYKWLCCKHTLNEPSSWLLMTFQISTECCFYDWLHRFQV